MTDQNLCCRKQRNRKNASGTAVPEALVRVARFERAASCSQGKRPTPGLHPDFLKFYTKNCNCGISCGRPPVSGVFKVFRIFEKSPCVRRFREDAGMSWAHGVMLPNVALYQLGYTRVFCIIHDEGGNCNPEIEKAAGFRKSLDSFPFLLYNVFVP